jgi:hypothetical protein
MVWRQQEINLAEATKQYQTTAENTANNSVEPPSQNIKHLASLSN